MATRLAQNPVSVKIACNTAVTGVLFYSIFTLVSQSIYSKSSADVLNSSLDNGLIIKPNHQSCRTNRFARLLMPMHENPIKALESSLVKEFRTCQALLFLTREEREALAKGEVLRLLALPSIKRLYWTD